MCVRVSRKFSLCNFTLESGIRAQSPWLCVFEGMSLLHSEGSVRGATGILLRCPFFFFFFLWGQKQAQVCFSYKPEGTWWFLTSVANSSLAGQSDHSFPQVLQESSGHRRKKKKNHEKKKQNQRGLALSRLSVGAWPLVLPPPRPTFKVMSVVFGAHLEFPSLY